MVLLVGRGTHIPFVTFPAYTHIHAGKKTQTFKNLHSQHINVLKFANHSPTVFATSSFDRDVKLWDMRQGTSKPIFTRQSDQGCVMVCFSPDDRCF